MSDGPIRSESDLLAFISSVMGEKMTPAREIAVRTVNSFPFFRAWSFEGTPASSESLPDNYLRKVRESDLVIWLVERNTTEPVAQEINTCMSEGVRLLVFMLPSESRDEVTKDLIGKVGDVGYAKWREVKTIDDLAEHIEKALSDEIIRAFRDPAPILRLVKLREMRQLSLSRCKRMWTSLNVQEEMATELAADQTVGETLAFPTSGVLRVEGDQGSGKTLAAERLFQRATDRALDDSSQPLPIFVSARDYQPPIEEYVENKSKDISRTSVTGSVIIVDGLDEIGVTAANSLLEELSNFTDAQPLATAVVTSRPLPDLKDDIGQRLTISTLDQQESTDLISRIAGQELELRDVYAWSESVRDAIKRPLFAIMLGSVLSDSPDSVFHRPTELVAILADRALRDVENAEKVDVLLQNLAVKAVSSGKSIHRHNVSPSPAQQKLLANSRLVNEQERKMDFTLPIFREWYAARALVEETFSFEDIDTTSDFWTIPLAIAVDSENEDFGYSLMAKLCSSDPGLASLVLQELDPIWPPDESGDFSLGTSLEAGEKFRKAMETWGQSLGTLYSIIGPVDSQGNTSTLGIEVNVEGTSMNKSWYRGTQKLPAVVELPKHVEPFTYNPEWSGLSFRRVPHTELWPWFISKDDLVHSLSHKVSLEHLALESMSIDAVRECSWAFSLGVQRQSTRRQVPISIQEILRYIEEKALNYVSLQLGYEGYYLNKHIKIVGHHLKKLANNGETSIFDPWPSADQLKTGTHRVWESYTSQRLLERTTKVFEGALRIYEAIVRKWFKAFSFRFDMYSCLPARLEGRITLPKGQVSFASDPVLTWRPIILSDNEVSEVVFELGVPDKLQKDFREGNESKSPFLMEQGLDVFGMLPATDLACKWLADDLQRLGWDK